MLKAGLADVDITPPLGSRRSPANGSADARDPHRSRASAAALIISWFTCLGGPVGSPVFGEGLKEDHDLAGHWEGLIRCSERRHTWFEIDVQQGEQGWHGTAYVPLWGEARRPLVGLDVRGTRISFTAQLPRSHRSGTFSGSVEGGRVRGIYAWNGRNYPFLLGREPLEKPKYSRRPQTPVPPHPYDEEDVKVISGPISLAGTVTVPKAPGPHPALVFLNGTGAQVRDGRPLGDPDTGHYLPWVMADRLTRAGYVVLRFDDRGVGGSTGPADHATVSDLAEDALAAVRYLQSRPDVRRDQVGVVGHSEGGVIGWLAASKSEQVAFVISLASPGEKVGDANAQFAEALVYSKGRKMFGADWEPGGSVRWWLQWHRLLYTLAAGSMTEGEIRAEILRENQRVADVSTLAPEIERQIRKCCGPYRSLLQLDPPALLRQVRVPALAVLGGSDLHVPPARNRDPIEAALKAGGNDDATVACFEELNHSLRKGDPENPLAPDPTEDTVDPAVLSLLESWLVKRFPPGRGGPAPVSN